MLLSQPPNLQLKLSDISITGDIVIVFGNGWVSKAINAITFGKASHAALVCGEQIYETDGAWRKSKYSEIVKYDTSKIRVFRIKSFTDEHRGNLLRVCERRLGEKYSYWDCFAQACFSFLNPKISERITNRINNPLRTKCDEETQICHNLARVQEYFKFPGGKNPQLLMEDLERSEDAELIFSSV